VGGDSLRHFQDNIVHALSLLYRDTEAVRETNRCTLALHALQWRECWLSS
jgi:hypothetical protein